MIDHKRIAKALYANREEIMSAIDKYVAKADDDLAKQLKKEGYADSKGTVEAISAFEEEVANILMDQTKSFVETLEDAEDYGADITDLPKIIDEFLSGDTTGDDIAEAAITMYEKLTPQLADLYMQKTEADMEVETLRQRTVEWFRSWGDTLGEIMQISTQNQITSMIQKAVRKSESIDALVQEAVENGSSIAELSRKIMEGGLRNEYYQAKRVALTEVLRAHSVAQEEAIQQSPASDQKEWRHTGAYKNNPRENHVAMDGQIVPKTEAFELQGRDGTTYYPMYPRDPLLPASECVNCHCVHRGIPNKDILGMSYEDRKKMQEEIVANDDKAWEKELDAKNKAKAGITELPTKERPISHTNTKAADSWAKKNLGVSKTNYTKQDIKNVNKVNRALQRVYKEYPELKGFVQEVRFTEKLSETTVASAKIAKTEDGYRTVLSLNQLYFDDSKALERLIKQQVAEGQWTPKRGLYGIIKHEMIHMRSYQYSLQSAAEVGEAWKDIMRNESALCAEIKKEALAACNLLDDYATIKEKLSEVATLDADEFVAEALSSSRSTKLTKKVLELFNEKAR